MGRRLWTGLIAGISLATPAAAWADSLSTRAGDTGVSAIWILANISYAGMRAQGHPSWGWRFLSFFVGFPGPLLSFLAIANGSCRAYGIVLPRREDLEDRS